MTDFVPLTPPGTNGSVYVTAHDRLPSGVGPGLGCVSNGTYVACSYQQSPNALVYYDASGNVLWTSGTRLDSNAYGSAPIIQADGSVVIGDDHTLYKFSSTGAVLWSTPSPGGGPVSLVTTPNGAIVSVTHQAPVGRCSQNNCQLAATINNPGSGYSTASVLFGGGNCPGAAAAATIGGGQITGVTITNQPPTCIVPPDIVIAGDGSNAVVTAQLRTPTPLIVYNGNTGAMVNSVYLYSNGVNSPYYGTVNTPCLNNASYPNRIYVSTALVGDQSQGALWALDVDPSNLASPVTPAWNVPFQGPSGASPLCIGNNIYFDGSGYEPGDTSGTTIFGVQDNGASGAMQFHVSLGPGSGSVTCNFALDPRPAGGFWHQLQYDPNIYHRDGTTGNLIETINVSNLLMANGAPPGTYWMRGVFTTYGTTARPYMLLSESDVSYVASYLAMVDIANSALVWALPFYPGNTAFETDTPEGAAALVMDSNSQPVLAVAGANTGAYFIAAGPGSLVLSAGSLNFGNATVGAAGASQAVTLTSNGSAPVHVSGVTVTGDFTQTDTCAAPLAPGTGCSISVSFNPGATGLRTGVLTVSDDAAGSPHAVALSGTGIASVPAIALSPAILNFASQMAGTVSPAQTVSLTNTGTGLLNVSGIVASGDAVATNNCPAALVPSGFCTIHVMFAPAAAGSRTGAVTVTGNAPNGPQSVSVSGVGATPSGAAASLSSTSLVFGAQGIGASGIAQIVMLSNAGAAILNISGVVATGDAAQSNNCGASLLPGAGCTIAVTFAPAAPGIRAGAVTISDNAADSPQTVGIFGVGLGNPVPLIYPETVPVSQFPGGPDFALTVSGSGFVPGAVVNWNGAPLATNFLTPTRLSAAVPAPAIAAPGTGRLAVSNPGPGGGLSAVVPFSIGNPSSSFYLARTDLVTGAGPEAVSVADFNADGKPDLAVADSAGNAVSIFLGNGDGTFAARVDYPAGSQPWAIAVGDFNGDGRQDLAIADQAGNSVSVLLGNGDGTFAPARSFAAGVNPVAIAAGDWDGDGALDLAVANRADNTVSILHGQGNGGFDPHIDYRCGALPSALVAGDFNSDGKLDLAVANDFTGGTVSVLLGNGDATLQPPVAYRAGDSVALAAADFNGDGEIDLAAISQMSQSLSVLPGNGDGTFQAAIVTPLSPGSAGIAVAALNNDAILQVATVTSVLGSVSILKSNNDGTFRVASNFGTAAGPVTLAVADFNGDGTPDLVTVSPGSNTASVLIQSAQAAFSSRSVNFGTVAVGGAAVQTVTLTNTGSAPMNLTGVAASGPFSALSNCPASVAPGNLCSITITFAPLIPGSQSGTLTVSSNIPPASVALTGSAVGVVTLSISQSAVVGGSTIGSNTASLTSPAPARGAVVALSSSNPAIAAVPASVTIAQGSTVSPAFSIVTTPVAATAQVTISANYAGVRSTAVLSVNPIAVASLVLSPSETGGGRVTSSNLVNLNAAAPPGGAAVLLSSSNPAVAVVPASVMVAAGSASSSAFSITTASVTSKTLVTISAAYGGLTVTATLTVNPPVVTSIKLAQTTITGGTSLASNRVLLNAPAPAGGMVISLSSSNSALASVPPSVSVPAGKMASQAFTISTTPVTSSTAVTLSATYQKTTKTATLTVSP